MNAMRLSTLVLVLMLSACATKTQSRVTSAATTPLSDLNIVREDIPEVLEYARHHPYQAPADKACSSITGEIAKLDEVLGSDLDAPDSGEGPSLMDRGTDAAENSAIGALQRTAEGLIPFRSWVRKLSGAERYSRKVSSAIAAGSIRRAFLKGVATSHGCTWLPPAPLMASAVAAPAPAPTPASASSSAAASLPQPAQAGVTASN